MAKIAVYPGSFDPLHFGHVDIIERLAKVYDHVIVLVSESVEKKYTFTATERNKMAEESLQHLSNVKVDVHQGLTVDYVSKKEGAIIARGLRAVVDFEFEMTMANMNKKLSAKTETLLMFAAPEFYYISSRGIKEIARYGGSLQDLVPPVIEKYLKARFS